MRSGSERREFPPHVSRLVAEAVSFTLTFTSTQLIPVSHQTMFRSPAARILLRESLQCTGPRNGTRGLNTLHQFPKRPQYQPHPHPHQQQHQPTTRLLLPPHRPFSSSDSTWTRSKQLYRKHPYQVTLALAIIAFASGSIIYVNYLYKHYIIDAYHNFPEPVAQKLRRAVYYSHTDVKVKEAMKYYRQALEVAHELGMDPFSDEIIGVKIQVAALMEKVQYYSKSIEVLEILKRDMLSWMDLLGNLERNKKKRTRVLKKAIAVSVKLGDLYSSPYVAEPAQAEEQLVWAVETILKERQRRDDKGVKDEDEDEWMPDDEIGASFEALAHHYEQQDKHFLSTPLFLQALSLKQTQDCHSVTLMNNLAMSLASQHPLRGREAESPSREVLVANAKQWAEKALDVAAGIKPPVRDDECDIACAVALHNLGEFAEMSKNVEAAKRRYKEAVSIARSVGFDEGRENSEAALKRLDGAA